MCAAAIIRPALERGRHDPIAADTGLKKRLASLKLPPKK